MNQRNLLEVDWSKIPAPTDDGAAVRPARANSLSPNGSDAAHWFIASAMDSSTRFTTNSCVARTFSAVSFGVPLSRSPGAKAQMGGFAPNRLKKLNGAAFTFPSAVMVVTSAIGRGVTRLARIG